MIVNRIIKMYALKNNRKNESLTLIPLFSSCVQNITIIQVKRHGFIALLFYI